jgi:hypothetical protein
MIAPRIIAAAAVFSATLCFGIGGRAEAETWSVPGFYSVAVDGWARSAIPDGFSYTCVRCTEKIEIDLRYTQELGPDAPWKSNSAFIAALNTEEEQRQFANEIMQLSVPTGAGFKIDILKVGLSDIGGLRVLMMAARVTLGSVITVDTTMTAVHKNRLMIVSLHSFDGSLTPQNKAAIDAFFDGLKFEM